MARRNKPPPAFVGRGGGVGPRLRKPRGSATAGGATLPPAGTYDPAIDAQRRAAARGLGDIETDVRAKRHFAEVDLIQALRDIRTETSRKRGDINRTAGRGQRKIGEQESDVQRRAGRANQDFDTQLLNIGRQFAQLGQRQREGANASGVLGGGTESAAAVARGRNQQIAEAPIHTARARTGEDLVTALQRLGLARSDLSEDQFREITQLQQDRDRSRKLSRRETGREKFGLKHEVERARREKQFSDIDLTLQAIYEARANRPGAFTKTGAPTGGGGKKKKKRRR